MNREQSMAEAPKSSSIREKFGTDYLLDKGEDDAPPLSTVSNAADALIERALAVHGTRILTMLEEQPQKTRTMYDIVDRTSLNIETVMGIVDRMVRTGLVQITSQDKYGNHTIGITQTGEELLKQQ
ncbi:MAG TPA: hypothetical protein VGV35_08925 [Bryobacteraceae bacterium]|nr:hypothetical protein [Bryobacteraceae bacterium]